jgi:hypothetical protein
MNDPFSSEILPIGDFYEQDAEGYVLNRCLADKIPVLWQPLIQEVADEMEAAWVDQLIGIYLRGSVPAGTAVAGVSDLDVFAMLEWEPGERFMRWETPVHFQEKVRDLQRAHPFASSVEMNCAHFDPEFPGRNPQLMMVLKTQSLCTRGRDLSISLPRYRPGPEMMIHCRWFASDFKQFQGRLVLEKAEIRTFMKILIRTGFELVMEREGRFATDLYPCWQAFARHEPRFAEAMESAIDIFLEPARMGPRLSPALTRLGNWMKSEIIRNGLNGNEGQSH